MNKNNTIITLTTDFGLKDYYVALIKGSILNQLPQAQIVDITHLIPPHDIVKAAYMLKNAYSSFPKNSIHIVSVNNQYNKESSLLVAKHKEQFFVVPNNGILSLLFDELPSPIFKIQNTSNTQNALKNIYATIATHLSEEDPLSDIGQKVNTIEERLTLKPVINASQIRGSVIHIDHYENVIVNIPKVLFEQVGHGRAFEIYFKRHDPIRSISTDYQSVSVGEVLCLFNSSDHLEIAISMGKAASMLGLNLDDTVQIDFKNVVL